MLTRNRRHETACIDHVAQVIQDFMQLRANFETLLPRELSDLRDGLDRMSLKLRSQDAIKYSLFYRVSSALYQKNNLSMGELSKRLSVPLSTATRMVDWLVDNEYAARSPDHKDRRIVRIALTGAGRRLHRAIDRYMQRRLDQVLSELTDDELMTLLALLHKAMIALQKLRQ